MKQVFIISLALLISIGLQAQSRNDLMGPAAKNYKPSKDNKHSSTLVVTQKKPDRLVGPVAKNYKPWRKNKAGTTLVVTNTKARRLIGPAAKNHKARKARKRS